MNKIRVLHVGLDSHLGGIETFLLSMAKNFDFDKYHFTFLCYKGENPCFYDELKALGCDFCFIAGRRDNIVKNRVELNKLFKTAHFDIVHCHQNSLSNSAPALIAIKNGAKVIIHSHNSGTIFGKTSLLHKINSFRFPFDKITPLAVSNLAGRWMFGNKVQFQVLDNGIDVKEFKFSESARARLPRRQARR